MYRRLPVHCIIFILHTHSEPFPVSSSTTTSDPSSDLIRFGLSNSCCDIAKQLLRDTSDSNNSLHTDSNITDTISPTPSSSPFRNNGGSVCMTKEGSEKLEQFIQKIVDSKLCRVCMDNPVSAVFCPCGHYMTCYPCARECKKCPLCRKNIAYVQYVYGSSS